jgi:AmmeMemoRadiSam system protein A
MQKEIQKYLLQLARNTIAKELGISAPELVRPENSEILDEKRGVFVTLEIEKALRGCIGTIIPVYTLENAVKRNAINAAFQDPRFWPLTKEEFENVGIEISVLSVPEKLKYDNAEDLLKKLRPLKDGVILKKGYYEATYLPQVWEELKDKEIFLGTLCVKAGMDFDEWRNGELEVSTYQAEVFGEFSI